MRKNHVPELDRRKLLTLSIAAAFLASTMTVMGSSIAFAADPTKVSVGNGAGTIFYTAHRIPNDSLWDPCFAHTCDQGNGPPEGDTWVWYDLYDSTNNIIAKGFANENGVLISGLTVGDTYRLQPSNCDHCGSNPHDVRFNNWGDCNTVQERPFAIKDGNMIIAAAYYRYHPLSEADKQLPCHKSPTNGSYSGGSGGGGGGSGPGTLQVNAVDSSNKPLTGSYFQVMQGSTTVKTGYTPASFSLPAGTYEVTVTDAGGFYFNHWSDGTTNRIDSVTISSASSTTLTAVYSTSQSSGGGGTRSAPAPAVNIADVYTALNLKSTIITTIVNGAPGTVTSVASANEANFTSLTAKMIPSTNLSGIPVGPHGVVTYYKSLYDIQNTNPDGLVKAMNAADALGIDWNSLSDMQKAYLAITLQFNAVTASSIPSTDLSGVPLGKEGAKITYHSLYDIANVDSSGLIQAMEAADALGINWSDLSDSQKEYMALTLDYGPPQPQL